MIEPFDETNNPPFMVEAPAEQRVPFVFNSPHSGRHYPASLLKNARLDTVQIRRSEDVMVDRLFSAMPRLGAPLLKACFPRAWLDVNREPYELDPRLFSERLPAHANTHSMRVLGGLGTIPRLVAENMPIYDQSPSLDEGLARVERIYRPYHENLRSLLSKTLMQFGYGVLVDCHSMPSQGGRSERHNRPDIIIGDRYGTSCHGDISRALLDQFTALGYSVARNKPYAGGFITEHYGRPLKGLHAVQIEINRALYMREDTLTLREGFNALQQDIETVMSHVMSLPDGQFSPIAQAAE
ncbi:MAG: N-formylglutamate amidohydrolase [Pseudomonadota bacterium]